MYILEGQFFEFKNFYKVITIKIKLFHERKLLENSEPLIKDELSQFWRLFKKMWNVKTKYNVILPLL